VAFSLRKTPMKVAALDYTHMENALAPGTTLWLRLAAASLRRFSSMSRGLKPIGRRVCGSMAAMDKRKSSRITGVVLILFGVMALLSSLRTPRIGSAYGSDRLKLIAVGLCFGMGTCLLAGRFRFPGE